MAKEVSLEKVIPIYEAVLDLLVENKEPANIKVIDISNRANIGKGTLYEYFDSKEEIILRAIIFEMTRKLGEIIELVKKQKNFESMIYSTMEWIDNNTKFRNCFTQILKIYLGGMNIPVELKAKIEVEHIRKSTECQPQILIEILEKQAKTEGLINSNITEDILTANLISQIGIYALYKLNSIELEEKVEISTKEFIYQNILKLIK